ncbi:MAG: fibronectin type III domain-containing protein, partial [Actinomycetes bacterium]
MTQSRLAIFATTTLFALSGFSMATVTPAGANTAPDAPTAVVATASNAQASVTWTEPSADGGDNITSYTVTAIDATASGNGGQTSSGSSSPIVVTGLTNGDSYSFTVYATNTNGDSSASDPSNSVTPATVPNSPSAPSVVEGFHAATVSWLPVVADGGATITSYIVTASPGGGSCSYTVSSPETDSCTVSGLDAETTYTFTVVAHNSVGDSDPSLPSADAIPFGNPNAPTAVSVLRQFNGEAVITWTRSTD